MNLESRSYLQSSLILTFRGLWSQYILWTRAYITNAVCNFGNLDFIKQRGTPLVPNILKTAEDFADALWKFYGHQNADEIESLLKEHFNISERLVSAVNNRDPQTVNNSITEWYQNADKIVEFLAGLNSNWSKQEWQNMLYKYLILLEDEATCHHASQYDADTYHHIENENQSVKMADYMAEGIINQFHL